LPFPTQLNTTLTRLNDPIQSRTHLISFLPRSLFLIFSRSDRVLLWIEIRVSAYSPFFFLMPKIFHFPFSPSSPTSPYLTNCPDTERFVLTPPLVLSAQLSFCTLDPTFVVDRTSCSRARLTSPLFCSRPGTGFVPLSVQPPDWGYVLPFRVPPVCLGFSPGRSWYPTLSQ